MSTPSMYQEMRDTLQGLTGAPVHVAPVSYIDWAVSVSRYGWKNILLKLHRVVLDQSDSVNDPGLILVGHSAGGVMARLYLSPEPFAGLRFAGLERVRHLITLGSPHGNVRGAPMRRWVNRQYPGAFFSPGVGYTTVAGRALQGDRGGKAKSRIAHTLYYHLSGEGGEWGDGVVPLSSAHLDGARNLVLDGVSHAPVGGRRWYGTAEVVREWWAQTNI